MSLAVYYINLESRPDRRQFMEEQFAALGVTATRVDAVTPADIPHTDLETYCNSANRLWMPPAALACNLSHERAWAQMIADGHQSALILEDDVKLSRSLPQVLVALELRPQRYSLIRIETLNRPLRMLPPEAQLANGISLRRCRSVNAGAAGYVITSRLAQALLGCSEMRTLLVDGLLYHPFIPIARKLDVAYTDPGLCIQLSFAEETENPAGRSNLDGPRDKGEYARRHPVRRFGRKVLSWFTLDARSALDHFYWSRRGLRTETILFRAD